MPLMHRLLLIVLPAALLPAGTTAQPASLYRGDLIRVHLAPEDSGRSDLAVPLSARGTIVSSSGQLVLLNTGESIETFPITRVVGIEIQQGRHWRKGAKIGFIAGSILGVGMACFDLAGGGCNASAGEQLLGALVGGTVMAIMPGAVIGSSFPRWVPAEPEVLRSSHIEPESAARPGAGGGIVSWLPIAGGVAIAGTAIGARISDPTLSDDSGPYVFTAIGITLATVGLVMKFKRSPTPEGPSTNEAKARSSRPPRLAPFVAVGATGLRAGLSLRH